jgi:hypothetical protein
MGRACWQAGPDGLYWIDVGLGNHKYSLMIDLGLVDPKDRVAFCLEPLLYNQLKMTGQLSRYLHQTYRDARGTISLTESGLIAAQLICPTTRLPVGPSLQLHVMHGSPRVPNRVGVVFFHHLKNCRVSWNLDNRTWCVDYP